MNIYLSLSLAYFLGWAIFTLKKLKGLQDKAKLSNVIFSIPEYFTGDILSHALSVVCLLLLLLLKDEAMSINKYTETYIKTLYGVLGYAGSDLISAFFGQINKRINAAIDHKTTISDTETGTLDAPTPK